MPDHERRDISVKMITVFFVSLAATGVVVLLLMWGLFALLKSGRPPGEVPPVAAAPPGPPLEIQDIKALRAAQDRQLESTGWVDRPAGVVRIPVERAMDLLIERGLPARER